MREITAEDFWPRVAMRGPDECWPWTMSCVPRGYGQTRFEKTDWLAHRLAWRLTHGPIPEGMLICHKCDNPPCCNPAHLFLGTPQDNMQDMVAKGRHAKVKRKKPACKNGHAFTPENTGQGKAGKRVCKTCMAAAHARWKAQHPEKFAAYREALNEARRTGRPVGRPVGVKELRPRRRRQAVR